MDIDSKKEITDPFAYKRMRLLLFIIIILSMSAFGTAQSEVEKGAEMRLTSPAFKNNEYIPKRFTCDGDNINPPLIIDNIPQGAKRLVLIVDDPDATRGTWLHWSVFDIPVVSKIEGDSVPGKQGITDSGTNDYDGPAPPSGTHRYYFRIYALDKELGLKEGAARQTIEEAMKGHVLASAELMGLYKRQ